MAKAKIKWDNNLNSKVILKLTEQEALAVQVAVGAVSPVNIGAFFLETFGNVFQALEALFEVTDCGYDDEEQELRFDRAPTMRWLE